MEYAVYNREVLYCSFCFMPALDLYHNIEDENLKLIVFDPNQEAIVKWILLCS